MKFEVVGPKTPDNKLKLSVRAKRLLIIKNNNKTSNADYLSWHKDVFRPLIIDIGKCIAQCMKTSTLLAPPQSAGLILSDEEVMAFSNKKVELENDAKFDNEIFNSNPHIKEDTR